MAAPFEVYEPILGMLTNNTGYTHAWQTCDQRFKRFMVASVDNPNEYAAAKSLGWVTFRTKFSGGDNFPREMTCPASEEGKKKVEGIIDVLTEKLYSHQHLIPRKEAKDIIGLNVRYASKEQEPLFMALYNTYRDELGISGTFNPALLLDHRT